MLHKKPGSGSIVNSDTLVEVKRPDSRSWWQHVPFASVKPPPRPKESIDDALLTPEASASFLSLITFGWITPLLSLGYARPLEAPDLWKLPDDCSASYIADKITESYLRRVKEAEEYNARLKNGYISPGLKGIWWSIKGNRKEKEKEWREKTGRKASLVWAMNESVKWRFWSGGLIKLVSDVARVSGPLVIKKLINFGQQSYAAHRRGTPAPPIGKGIGLAFVLFLLQVIPSLCSYHYFYRSAATGVLLRGGLITAIYKRSLRLSARARSTLTNGKLISHISTDVSRIDYCANWFHMAWTNPIRIIIVLILLIVNLGPSAIAGFACFLLATPIQITVMKRLSILRRNSMEWTDKRVKLLQELLGGIKAIKFFTWELPFLARIAECRKKEMEYIRSLLLIRSGMNAVAASIPVLASILAFITYSATGHTLDPAVIFTSLAFFGLLQTPSQYIPIAFSSIADAVNATSRLRAIFEAELMEKTYTVDGNLDVALEVKGASFTWDSPLLEDVDQVYKGEKGSQTHHAFKANQATYALADMLPAHDTSKEKEKANSDEKTVFMVRDVNMSIPRGQLVGIVGRVGSGKTSLLQGLIGEMRKTAGNITFGGTVGYCQQTAWIQCATIRENICFGKPFEEERYWRAVHDSCLDPDLEVLPSGDMTEVGENGILLSGGQKQRLSICRAIYGDSDIQIFDDPLSALDAHVGRAVFQNVLQTSLAGKTRILVTHALHFLPEVDYIYVVVDGSIAEQGTYAELMNCGGEFSKFFTQFGSSEKEKAKEEEEGATDSEANLVKGFSAAADEKEPLKSKDEKRRKATAGVTLMQTEERQTGAVAWDAYKSYIRAGKGEVVMPFFLLCLALTQAATVLSSYWLVWWQQTAWPQPNKFYMGIYAALGVAQAVTCFFMGATLAILTYFASRRLHEDAIRRVVHAPMSFFETTPLGRVVGRFSKDIDTIDNLLGDTLLIVIGPLSSTVGAVVLISTVLPWFLIGVVVILVGYIYIAIFYQASGRELKRLDSILRSSLYSHFSESLSGLATIRAYGESGRFCKDNERRVDVENRAYWLLVASPSWLLIRIDILGALLTFIVAMLAVGTRFTISPAQTGLAISYIMSVHNTLGYMVRQCVDVENHMNAVERIVYYAKDIEQEAPHELPDKKLPPSWPASGQLEIRDVVLRYRPELPPVINGISMSVKGGEKIGIVGRTGAGKSSIMTVLYRLVELSSGSIVLDGVDVCNIGLTDLRQKLAIIPQDPLLFSGTLRTNLDPFNLHDDVTLWDALKRSHLVESVKGNLSPINGDEPSGEHAPSTRFSLDTLIQEEGSNLSVGQRSMVSLARALVKNSKVIILDEATASVDYETDRKIHDTIAYEFKDRTILCIAHRLRTIISYDRICVLDAGQIAEFDTPTNLFKYDDGMFRGMCNQSGITLDDIKLATKPVTGGHWI